ncbi:WXG100 family type VII secretion target [Kitasatospora sp. LaBMicrA B282]|uniref:WXG100 family type VII secretion target n=1 Tax=Kitasatospora sp. LaBMicrA B282 TaxID=3420949 RepID=UPI003D0E9460
MSTDGAISVNFGTIQDAGGQVRAAAGRIDHQLDELKKGVQKIAGSWSGAAKDGYNARQAIWDQKAKDLHDTLMKIADALDKAHEGYTTTESDNLKIWQP